MSEKRDCCTPRREHARASGAPGASLSFRRGIMAGGDARRTEIPIGMTGQAGPHGRRARLASGCCKLYCFDSSRNIIDAQRATGYVSNMKLDDAAARLEALGNPTRLKIYRTLVKAGDNGLSVGKLQSRLDIAPSTLSHHLKSMLIVGLIYQERQSTTLICRADYDVMRSLVGFLVSECCADGACRPAPSKADAA